MNTDDLQERAQLLPDALEAAGHPPGAIGVARFAAKRGLAPATTVQLLEAAGHAPAAALGHVMFGTAAAATDTPDLSAAPGIGATADQLPAGAPQAAPQSPPAAAGGAPVVPGVPLTAEQVKGMSQEELASLPADRWTEALAALKAAA